jgi:hypothetical protein
MKKFTLIIFFSYLISINISKSLFSTNLKKKNTQDCPSTITQFKPENMAILKTKDISARTEEWICTEDNKLLRNGAVQSVTIVGSKPESCEKIATNNNGDIFVVTTDNKLFLFKKINADSRAWINLEMEKVQDVSVGINNEVFIVDTSGVIKKLSTGKITTDFNKTAFGSDCRIAMSREKGEIVYLVDKKGQFFRVSLTESLQLYPSVLAFDVCVDNETNVILAASDGIFVKKSRNNQFVKIGEGIAGRLGCWNKKLWFIGLDNLVYRSDY